MIIERLRYYEKCWFYQIPLPSLKGAKTIMPNECLWFFKIVSSGTNVQNVNQFNSMFFSRWKAVNVIPWTSRWCTLGWKTTTPTATWENWRPNVEATGGSHTSQMTSGIVILQNLWARYNMTYMELFTSHRKESLFKPDFPLSQLSNLWWMPNSFCMGFDTAMKTGSSRRFKQYPTTYIWVSSRLPFTED